MGVSTMYKDQTADKQNLSKAEQISKNFTQLVMQNYTMQRSVAWYAKRLGITQAHLSSIVKQTTGKTCVEIITYMVIMDAKAQLKSTNLSIHDISYALNFTNMSPQEYRNSKSILTTPNTPYPSSYTVSPPPDAVPLYVRNLPSPLSYGKLSRYDRKHGQKGRGAAWPFSRWRGLPHQGQRIGGAI